MVSEQAREILWEALMELDKGHWEKSSDLSLRAAALLKHDRLGHDIQRCLADYRRALEHGPRNC